MQYRCSCAAIDRSASACLLMTAAMLCPRRFTPNQVGKQTPSFPFFFPSFLTTHEAAWYTISVVSVCLSLCICMYVCQTITFASLDVGSSYLHIWCISMEYGSSSYMKVIGSRCEGHRSKKAENVKLRSDITPLLKKHKSLDVCMYMGFFDMMDQML